MRKEVIIPIVFGILLWELSSIYGATDPSDAAALRGMYGTLNSPSQLTKWNSSGGDPCGDSWKGITCSGSRVTEIKLSGLGLSGSLGYQLTSLTSVTNFDVSNNKFGNQIPYQLPPNVQKLNLAGCGFSGVIPYSISQMASLKYLNLSHNQLQGSLNDMFQSLSSLSTMDLSGNEMSGELPKSLSSLSNMTNMYLQNNQFTGSINVLANLPLENLNVKNNRLSGWIPEQLKGIKLQKDGNSWSSSPAPPPPPGTPPATRPKRDRSSSSDVDRNKNIPSDSHSKVQKNPPDDGGSGGSRGSGSKSGIGAGAVAGVVISILVVAAAVLAIFIMKKRKSKRSSYIDLEKLNKDPFKPITSQELQGVKSTQTSIEANTKKTFESAGSINPRPPPVIDSHKSFAKDDLSKESMVTKKVDAGPVNYTRYSLADLKMATDNFSVANIVGEGSIGCCVYRGRFDEKVLAVKEIDPSCIPNPEDFNGIVTGISQLRHPNITELVGYCSERGQHLLVYEYHNKGSLHDLLHENSEPLELETRMKIALGTAQALAYLHDVCSPSVAHKKLKSANILLDMDLSPHLSDCGLACLHPSGDEAKNNSGGTGYTAPEVLKQESQYTIMSDVYSFGVIMLELLSGRQAFDRSRPKSEQYLVRWAKPQLHDIDALENMADPTLGGTYSAKSLSRFADVIASCVQREPEFRPPISEVVETLVRLLQRANVSKRLRDNE